MPDEHPEAAQMLAQLDGARREALAGLLGAAVPFAFALFGYRALTRQRAELRASLLPAPVDEAPAVQCIAMHEVAGLVGRCHRAAGHADRHVDAMGDEFE